MLIWCQDSVDSSFTTRYLIFDPAFVNLPFGIKSVVGGAMDEKHRSLTRCPIIVPETRTEISAATPPITYIAIVGTINHQIVQTQIREPEPLAWFKQTCLVQGRKGHDRLDPETSLIIQKRLHHCITAPGMAHEPDSFEIKLFEEW